jgi:hypothetical protein
MKKQKIPVRDFDLPRFIQTLVAFWGDPETAFPLVADNGFADFGTDCLEDEAEEAGDNPLAWLRHGNTLFGQFTRRAGDYELADGSRLRILDEEDADEEDEGGERNACEAVHDDGKTQLDECSTYGFLLKLKGDTLTVQTARLSDVTGECVVRAVKNAGVFEDRMVRFVESLKRRGE